MRPLPFAILAVLTLVVQLILGQAIALTGSGFQPQFLLILAMFIALYARVDSALIGCWTLGLLMDLNGSSPMGVFAFAYGLLGLGIVSVRGSLFRDHPVSHFVLAFVFGLLADGIVVLREAVTNASGFQAHLLVVHPLGVAIYTALLAPWVMLLLGRLRRWMNLPERP